MSRLNPSVSVSLVVSLAGALLGAALLSAAPMSAGPLPFQESTPTTGWQGAVPPVRPLVSGALERLRETVAAREKRDVIVAMVSEREVAKTPDAARTVLRNQTLRVRVFAPGTMGYTFIPPRPQAVVVFVNTDRVERPLVDLIAAHELGHVLLHSRGFLQVVMFPDDPREPILTDSFNVVQDVLLERELAALGVDTTPLLQRQARTISRALSMSGPSGIVPDSGKLQTSHLATMVTPLLMTLKSTDSSRQRLERELPRDVSRLVAKYTKILSGPVRTPAEYREVMYQACEANGLGRSQVAFAPD